MYKLSLFSIAPGILLGLAASQAGTPPKSDALIAKGKSLYTTNCLTCHGAVGDGNGPAGAVMNPKPRHLGKDKFKKGSKPEQVFGTITNGLEGTSMTSFSYLPEEDRWALTYYVLSFRKGGK